MNRCRSTARAALRSQFRNEYPAEPENVTTLGRLPTSSTRLGFRQRRFRTTKTQS
jgi:hypothetical protein